MFAAIIHEIVYSVNETTYDLPTASWVYFDESVLNVQQGWAYVDGIFYEIHPDRVFDLNKQSAMSSRYEFLKMTGEYVTESMIVGVPISNSLKNLYKQAKDEIPLIEAITDPAVLDQYDIEFQYDPVHLDLEVLWTTS